METMCNFNLTYVNFQNVKLTSEFSHTKVHKPADATGMADDAGNHADSPSSEGSDASQVEVLPPAKQPKIGDGENSPSASRGSDDAEEFLRMLLKLVVDTGVYRCGAYSRDKSKLWRQVQAHLEAWYVLHILPPGTLPAGAPQAHTHGVRAQAGTQNSCWFMVVRGCGREKGLVWGIGL